MEGRLEKEARRCRVMAPCIALLDRSPVSFVACSSLGPVGHA